MATIYLVTGSVGAYSDHTVWNVCAFATKARAEAFAQKCRDDAVKVAEAWAALREPTAEVENCLGWPKNPTFDMLPKPDQQRLLAAWALEEAGQKTILFKHDLTANEQHRGSCAADIGYGIEEVRLVP